MMRPRILFIVQLPPPIHGVTIMNQHTIDNPGWRLKYDVKTLPLHFGQTLDDIGKITMMKVVHMFGFIFKLCRILISFKPSIVYFTIVPTGKIFYRDAIFSALIKLFCRRVVFLSGNLLLQFRVRLLLVLPLWFFPVMINNGYGLVF